MPDLSTKTKSRRKGRRKHKVDKGIATKKMRGGYPFSGFFSSIGNYFTSFGGVKKDINTTAEKFGEVKTEIQKNITELNKSLNNVLPLLDDCSKSMNTASDIAKKINAEGPPTAEQQQIALQQPARLPSPAPPTAQQQTAQQQTADPFKIGQDSLMGGGSSCGAKKNPKKPKKSRKKKSMD